MFTRPMHRRHCQLLFTRHASISSKHPFPFPTSTNPAPYDIFHLPRNASQHEIKSRYYELVKVYHPDAARGQHESPSVRNARFRAITQAYGVLSGRPPTPSPGAWADYASRDEAIRAELRRRSRRSSPSTMTTADTTTNDAQIWYSLVAFVLVGMIAAMGAVSSHMDGVERHSQFAAANLAQARTDAQIHGMERRRKIRERVRAHHEARETVDGTDHLETSRVWLADLSRAEKSANR